MLRPTFSGFQVAKSGLTVSQKLLDVTGQNITNVNTEGYTRQRVDLYSIAYSSGNTQYSNLKNGIGRGVGDLGASQIRDPFLDIRYRTEAAKVGKQDVMNEALDDLSEIFDEITKTGLDTQFSNMITQLQALSASPSDPVIEGVVKTSASMITQLFNHYAKQIDNVREQQIGYLEENVVSDINNTLTAIAELNKQIREQNIHGDKALELNDRRNTLIDNLSTYMNIEVVRSSEDIGNGVEIEVLSIVSKDIQDTTTVPPTNMVLISGKEAAQIGVDASDKTNVKITLNTSIDPAFADGTDITSSLDQGELSGYLAFLNNKAEFTDSSTYSTEDRGIQYYEGLLNKVANQFAKMFNEANTKDTDGDGVDDVIKPLFEAEGGGEITAANIKISEEWRNSTDSYIINSKNNSVGDDNSAANDNILNMISLFSKDFEFTYSSTDANGADVNNFLFKGTLQECFSHAVTTLDLQKSNTNELYKSYGTTLLAIDTSRASISSVSIDEEGINLLTYNKSYSAAARFMTTLDDALSTLINNTGRVGL